MSGLTDRPQRRASLGVAPSWSSPPRDPTRRSASEDSPAQPGSRNVRNGLGTAGWLHWAQRTMPSTSRGAPEGRMTATGRRLRLASPAAAAALGVVALLGEAAQFVLEGL